jgi:ATP-dependent RNA helicase DDX19/DBP5
MSVVVAMGKFTPVLTEYAIKDHLQKGSGPITAHIVVGTPGTMTDLLRKRIIDPSNVRVFVLDEADNMLDQDGLGDQTLRVKKYVKILREVSRVIILMRNSSFSMLPRSPVPQIILFSATFPDHVRNFANKFAPNANKIELQKNEIAVDAIRQFYMDCKNEEQKYDILVSLYSLLTIGQSIIFCMVRCSLPSVLFWDAIFTMQLASSYCRSYRATHDCWRT